MNSIFLKPTIRPAHIDRFIVRHSILKTIQDSHPHLRGRCLDVGCGDMPYRELLMSSHFKINEIIGLDQDHNRFQTTPPDIVWTDGKIPLPSSSIDSAICTEVLEHCPNPKSILLEIQRVLKPGASLIITVPFLWPLHEVPYDWSRYTPFALRQLLEESGFSVQELRPLGGYDRSMAQMLALWLRRRPMNRWIRASLTLLLYPFWTLLRISREPDASSFKEGTMITGLMARAEKQ